MRCVDREVADRIVGVGDQKMCSLRFSMVGVLCLALSACCTQFASNGTSKSETPEAEEVDAIETTDEVVADEPQPASTTEEDELVKEDACDPLVLTPRNIEGSVTYQREGSTRWRRVRDGSEIRDGDRVQTGLDSQVILVNEECGIEVYISPTSQITVTRCLIPASDVDPDAPHVDIRFGGVRVNVAQGTRRTDFEVAPCTTQSTPSG